MKKSEKLLNKHEPDVLKRRLIPKQERSIQTVNHILEVSATILDEVGLDDFNTNLLAKRCNLRVATIYRYFPNKLSIIVELSHRWYDICETEIPAHRELGDISKDWKHVVDDMVDIYVELARKYPGFLAIRRALQANTVLREIESEAISRVAQTLVDSLQKRGINNDIEELQAFTKTFLVAGVSAVDLAWSTQKRGTVDRIFVEQVKRLSRAYFSTYLD